MAHPYYFGVAYIMNRDTFVIPNEYVIRIFATETEAISHAQNLARKNYDAYVFQAIKLVKKKPEPIVVEELSLT